MSENTQQQAQQLKEQGETSLPASPVEMSVLQRSKYALATGIGTGAGALVMGFAEYSLLLAAAGGVVGYVFSDNMRNFIIDHAPAPKVARSRKSKLNWWITGRVESEEGSDPESEEEADVHFTDGFEEEKKPESRQRRLPRQIVLSPDLQFERNEVIGKSIFIVGQRRSGKTTLGALLAEQMGQYSVPIFIPDSEGDLLSVYDLLPRGVIAAAPGSRWEEEDVHLWTVTPEDADVLGFNILDEGMQVIFDMSSFEDQDEAWRVVNGVIYGLFSYARDYPDLLCPVEVFLDEAQKYLPQDLNTSAIQNAETRNALLKSYRDISGTGGKRGITPVILSQRFAETNNQIIAQTELRFILRQTQDNDLDRCKKYIRAETATPQQIASFQKGQGVFVGEDGEQIVTTFNQRQSDGRRSSTPTVEAVERFADKPLRLQKQPVQKREEARAGQPEPALRVLPKPAGKEQREATYEDAVEVWNECGGGIGRPRLQKELQARGLECSDYLAGKLLAQITAELAKQQAVDVVGDVAVGDE